MEWRHTEQEWHRCIRRSTKWRCMLLCMKSRVGRGKEVYKRKVCPGVTTNPKHTPPTATTRSFAHVFIGVANFERVGSGRCRKQSTTHKEQSECASKSHLRSTTRWRWRWHLRGLDVRSANSVCKTNDVVPSNLCVCAPTRAGVTCFGVGQLSCE